MLRRVLLIAMLLLSALLVGIPSGQAGASSTYSTFTGAAGTCIDNLSSATANNNVVGLYTCNNTGAQAWTVDAADSQPGTIVNSNGFCLRAAGGGITPGTAVVISGCEGQPSEEWTYGHDSIVNVDSGLCVQDWTNRTEDDDPLVLNTCNGSQTQQWIENARPDNNIDLSTFFPIGVETQTNDDSVTTCDFECWKNRGINTLVNVPVGADEADWDFSARLDGLKEIRPPSSNIIADASDPALIGWAQPDEPDVEKIPHAAIQSNFDWWKTVDPTLPVFENFYGGFNDLTRSEYRSQASDADWISADDYPFNTGNKIPVLTYEVAAEQQYAGTRPVFAFIETGPIFSGNDYPRPDQLREEIWTAIIQGARGIWYFPCQVFPHFIYDVTPPANVAEITSDDSLITELTNVLQSPINPQGVNATGSNLAVSTRTFGGSNYYIVLNTTDRQQNNVVISLKGTGSASEAAVYNESRSLPVVGGTVTDNFGPYALHIYEVG
ncbi:MAG: RICIN domain-containing protein [Acidimicrobiales bacterium]